MTKRASGRKEIKDTGIYTREYWVGPPPPIKWLSDQEVADMTAAMDADGESTTILNRALAQFTDRALEILEPFRLPADAPLVRAKSTRIVLLPVGPVYLQLPQEADELAHDAADLLAQISGVQRCSGDARVLNAMRAGQLLERMNIRSCEPLAMIGRKRRAAGKKAAEAKNKDYQKERPYYQGVVDGYQSDGYSYDMACHLAADHDFIGCYWTIKDHTENKTPRNRGRKNR